MSERGGRSSRLGLRLSLSPTPPGSPTPPRSPTPPGSPEFSTSSMLSYSSEITGERSCLSSDQVEQNVELQQHQNEHEHGHKGRNQVIRDMLLVGCPRCLMYVMLSEVDTDPKCPKCKNTVLLDFLNEQNYSKKPQTP